MLLIPTAPCRHITQVWSATGKLGRAHYGSCRRGDPKDLHDGCMRRRQDRSTAGNGHDHRDSIGLWALNQRLTVQELQSRPVVESFWSRESTLGRRLFCILSLARFSSRENSTRTAASVLLSFWALSLHSNPAAKLGKSIFRAWTQVVPRCIKTIMLFRRKLARWSVTDDYTMWKRDVRIIQLR
jgi:hypothetical protein